MGKGISGGIVAAKALGWEQLDIFQDLEETGRQMSKSWEKELGSDLT